MNDMCIEVIIFEYIFILNVTTITYIHTYYFCIEIQF